MVNIFPSALLRTLPRAPDSPRIGSVQEARAVCKAVSSQIAQEAGFSEYVCPFAFRLSCNEVLKAPRRLEALPREAPVADDESTGDVTQEGFCDNGDVGSGEKLLYLLQRRGLRHIVLVVSRINGGFMMAELLGIRRHEKKHQTQGLDLRCTISSPFRRTFTAFLFQRFRLFSSSITSTKPPPRPRCRHVLFLILGTNLLWTEPRDC